MSFLVPGASTAGQQAAIKKLEGDLNGQLAAIDAKFAGRTFVAADVSDEISRVANIVRQWYVIEYGGAYDEVARFFFKYDSDKLVGIADLIDKIGTVQDFMTSVEQGLNADFAADYVFDSTDSQWHDLYQAERAPIEWLAGVAPPTLQNFSEWDSALTKAVDAVSNIPSATIKWTLDQLLKALGLPTWLLPAMGITAIAGLGAWAYFSFLAPVGASAKLLRLRKNPRRHRYRRRRKARS